MRALPSLLLLGGLFTLQACTETIRVDNTSAVLSEVDSVTRGEESNVRIAYTIVDAEGDDQGVLVEICEGSEAAPTRCGLAFEGDGSDNTSFVPTRSDGAPIRHVFAWNAACGRVVESARIPSEPALSYVARLSIKGSDPISWSYSPEFTLNDLGLDTLTMCIR